MHSIMNTNPYKLHVHIVIVYFLYIKTKPLTIQFYYNYRRCIITINAENCCYELNICSFKAHVLLVLHCFVSVDEYTFLIVSPQKAQDDVIM